MDPEIQVGDMKDEQVLQQSFISSYESVSDMKEVKGVCTYVCGCLCNYRSRLSK